MNAKFIGGILLIVGTSIGGGMLALPIVNASSFWQSTLLLVLCWAVMTLAAFFILEANLYLPSGKHMVSMAISTLGLPGLVTAWLSYLFLLYALLSAYISGGADVFGALLQHMGLPIKEWQASLVFTLCFGSIVYRGIRHVDLLNRVLMFGKLGVFLLLVVLITPYIEQEKLSGSHYTVLTNNIMVLITSFGFAIIVPNLRVYFNDNLQTLKRVILIGSIIPLVCYIAWDAVIIGCLPSDTLMTLRYDGHPTSTLAAMLSLAIKSSIINYLFNFFTSICMVTAFLSVSLCLMSFLADGLNVNQTGKEGAGIFLLTFGPPLLLVIFYPGIYIHALDYAGTLCVILLLLLPALMTFFGRTKFPSVYLAPGGKVTQLVVMLVAIVLLWCAFY